ncbi:MAG: hypothetical protein ABGY42_02805, partial [bacterium]
RTSKGHAIRGRDRLLRFFCQFLQIHFVSSSTPRISTIEALTRGPVDKPHGVRAPPGAEPLAARCMAGARAKW